MRVCMCVCVLVCVSVGACGGACLRVYFVHARVLVSVRVRVRLRLYACVFPRVPCLIFLFDFVFPASATDPPPLATHSNTNAISMPTDPF